MAKLKSHKSVESIAKKHGVDVSFIKKQLKMGEPIEHEHTKDHDLAKDIALQHLDEIPDYYTRLKKMEISAKKGLKSVSEETVDGDDMDSPVKMRPINAVHIDYEKRYCPKCKKVELRSECQYGPRFWDIFSLPEKLKEHCGCENTAVKELEIGLKKLNDISYDSIDTLMRRIMKKHNMSAKQLHNAFVDKHNKIPDEWIKQLKEGTLHHWFKGSKSKDGKPGWVQADGSPCANEPGETKTPKCFSSGRLAALKRKGEKGESLIRSAVRRKRKEDPSQQQKSGSEKPTMVSTFAKGRKDPNYIKAEPKLKEEMQINESQKDRPSKGSGKKDACYHKVKSRYDVWPSAYASGALVKCRKVGAANWGTKSEETIMEKDHEYSMIRSELSTIRNAVHRLQKKMKTGEGNVEAWVQSKITRAADYLDSAADYVDSGEMEESIGFTIDTSVHRAKQKREKIRNLAVRGATEGERSVASKKLGSTAELPKLKKEENEVEEMKCWPGYKKKGTQKLFGKRYNRCVKAENTTIEDAEGNTFVEIVDLILPDPIKIEEATRIQSQTGNVVIITLLWRGKYYSLRMFFPQVKMPSRQEMSDELQKVYPGCKIVAHSISQFNPGEPLIQALGPQGGSLAKLGPNKNYVKPMGEDWQKVNRQDKTDGLSQKAVDAYRRENPGSKLKTAVTEKNPTGKRAERRKSFCRRMSGMKKRLTSAETARDPDSRINKALRRWNCN